MITMAGTVCVFVSDQQPAMDFYFNKLGMELKQDAELFLGAKNRWISVAPKGAVTEILLYLPHENWEHYKQVVAKSQSVTLTIEHMTATIASEPDAQPWGTNAAILDSEGNWLLLVENPKF